MRRLVVSSLSLLIVVASFANTTSARERPTSSAPLEASPASSDEFVISRNLAPLGDAKTWVLQGRRLANGACRYTYPSVEALIPLDGWVARTIAVDMLGCRKLFEEGTPSAFAKDVAPVIPGIAPPGTLRDGQDSAVASVKGAWQRVIWRDLPGLLTTADMTQINWTYNGSTSSAGTTSAAWQLNTATKWQLTASSVTQLYGPSSSYYRGQTTATFTNSFFCAPLPTVHTYYFYNRVWGHPNGTATRSQSSDSVDECLPLHVDIESAYGQWPG